MALEESRYFTGLMADERHNADGIAGYFDNFTTNGALTLDTNLQVTAAGGMVLNINYGSAMIRGYKYNLKNNGSGVMQLTIDAGSSQPRIDKIIIRLDTANKSIKLAVKKGTPAATPATPALTQTDAVYEISLARVNVGAGAASLSSANITDERSISGINAEFLNGYGQNKILKATERLPTGTDLNTVFENMYCEVYAADALVNTPTGQTGGSSVFECILTYEGITKRRAIQKWTNVFVKRSWIRFYTADAPVGWSPWYEDCFDADKFMRRAGSIDAVSTNFDNVTQNGIYTFGAITGYTNHPGFSWGTLQVTEGMGSDNYIKQEAWEYNGDRHKVRYRKNISSGGDWYPWLDVVRSEQSLAVNSGYCKLESGFIMQYGGVLITPVANTVTSATITLPISFSSTSSYKIGCNVRTSNPYNAVRGATAVPHGSNANQIILYILRTDALATTVEFTAMGY